MIKRQTTPQNLGCVCNLEPRDKNGKIKFLVPLESAASVMVVVLYSEEKGFRVRKSPSVVEQGHIAEVDVGLVKGTTTLHT